MDSEKFDLIFETMAIYIKYLLGKEVSSNEEEQFLKYSTQGISKATLNLDLDSYLDESCFQMGDLVLQFENPDIPDKKNKYKTVNFEKALKFFEKAIGLCYNIQYKSENLDSALLRLAFIQAYFQLKDATQDDEKYSEVLYENVVSQFCAQVRVMTKLQRRKKERKNIITDEDLQDQQSDDDLQKTIQQFKRLAFENTLEQSAKQTPKKDEKKKNKKSNNSTIIKQKMMNKGKFFKEKRGTWVRTKYQVQDFMTLARNLLLLRLAQKGFKVRTFVSAQSDPKGAYIYAVLYQSDYNLQITAEQMELQKFLNLEFTDLLSLEPVNKSYRPIRLDNRLWRKDIEYPRLSNYFKYIKPQIVELLKSINFKKMAKEVNIQQLNEQMFNDGKEDIIHDEQVITDNQWEQYYKYLIALSERVNRARQEFYFKAEFATYFNAVRKYHIERKNNKSRIIHEYVNLRVVKREEFIFRFKTKMLSRFKKILRDGRKKWQDQEHIMSDFFLVDYESQLTRILKRILDVVETQKKHDMLTGYQLLEALQDQYAINDKVFNQDYFNQEYDSEECLILRALPDQFQDQQDLSNSDLNRSMTQSQIKFQYHNTIFQELQIKLFELYLQEEINQWDIDIKKYEQGMETLKTITKTSSNNTHQHLSTKLIKQRSREILALRYGNALREALQIANYRSNFKLQNIWSIGEFENLQLSSQYYSVYHKLPKSKINSIMNIWQKYIISENGRISTFTIMERLKIINNIASQSLNLAYLIENEHILKYYALNDLYELTNKKNKDLFDQNKHSSNLSMTSIKTEISQSSINDEEVVEKQLFVEPKLKNLQKQWRFRIFKPWYIPSLAIRNYYGEKIAIYYSFIGHYTYCLLTPGIVGLIFSLIQYVVNHEFTKVLAIIYGFYHASFLRVFLGRWQRRESSLAALFGASSTSKKAKQQERPSFEGDYQRDTVTDQLNTQYFSSAKFGKQIGLNTLLMVMVLCLYFGCIIGLFQLTYLFEYYKVFDSLYALSFLKLEASIPALINVILFQLFDQFYEKLAQELTKNENHKTSEDFEEQYIMKRFSMQIVSYFAPLLFISFLSTYLPGFTCAFGSCFLHSSYYFTAIFWILFLQNIQDVIQIVYSKLTAIPVITKGTQQEKINSYIESEGNKESYLESLDIYGTVNDYLEIVTQACLLGLFGVFFPGSLFIAFIWNVLEIQTDKLKLIEESQRPIPINESAIGIWGTAIDILGNISLLYNSGLIYKLINSFTEVDFGFFIYVLLFNIVVSASLDGAFTGKSYEIEQIVGRHKYLLKSTIEMFKKTESFYQALSDSKPYIRFPILKVYNTLNENVQRIVRYQQNEYSELSIENEIQQNQSQQQVLYVEEINQKKLKPIFCFNFPQKKFNNVKEQKQYNNRLEHLRQLLQNFEKSHQLKWSEIRFIYRRYYIRREMRILKNLNMVKLNAFLYNYNELFDLFFKIEEGKKSKELNNDNQDEKNDLLKYIKQYCKKKSHQVVRQVVIIKVKGVWFSQYRKQTPKMKSIEIMRSIKRIQIENAKKYNQNTAVTLQSINNTPETLVKDRKLIFNQIRQLDLTKLNQADLLRLAVKSKSDYELEKKYKNTLVRNIEQLYSYEVKKIEIMQTQIYHIEFPEYLIPSQIALREIFCTIGQKSQLRDLELDLQYQLSSSYTAKYPKIQKFFKATRGYQQWFIKNSVLETRDISLNENLTISSLQSNQYFNEWGLLDIFLYPSLKGIQATVISQKNILPWTLKDTVAYKKESRYKDSELDLLNFLLDLLKTVLPKQQRVLNITSIFALKSQEGITYHFSWVNHWNRRLNIKNYEFLCISPDLHLQKGTPVSNQVYNIGIVLLYVMTQGQGLVDISQKIEALDKITIPDVKKIIEDYLVSITLKSMESYPILFTILLDILFSDKYRNDLKFLQSLISSESQAIYSTRTKQEQSQVALQNHILSEQIYQIAMARLKDNLEYSEIRLFDGDEMINRHQANIFHDHLTVDLYKLQTLFKLKCPTQMKAAINALQFKFNQTFQSKDWQEAVLSNLDYFCGHSQHSKILCDLLNAMMFKSLMHFINRLTITDFKTDQYVTVIEEDLRFIDKLKVHTSERCLEAEKSQNDIIKIKKRLRVMAEHYKELHFEFDQIISKLQYLRLYTTMLAQQALHSNFEFQNLKPAQELSLRIIHALRKSPQEGLMLFDKLQMEQLHQFHQLKMLFFQRNLELYLNRWTIQAKLNSECIFEQILIHQHTVIDADILWNQDQEFQPYELINVMMKHYEQNKCQDLLIQSQILLLTVVDHLHYDKDMHLVEEALRLVYMSKACFQTYFLAAKLLNVLNTHSGAISSGILCQSDQSTVQTEERYLKLALVILPVGWTYRDDLLNSFIFEVQARIGTNSEIIKFSNYVNNVNLQFRRLFIIAKLYFQKEKYQEAVKLFKSCLTLLAPVQELQPTVARGMRQKTLKIEEQQPASKIVRQKTMKAEDQLIESPQQQYFSKVIYPWLMKCELFQSKIPSNTSFDPSKWNHFFITLIFDLKNLNAQVITRIMSRIIQDQQLKRDDKTFNMNEFTQAQICFVKLLLQEYLDQDNKYIKSSFQVKHFILTTINKVLQDISRVKINDSYDVERDIQRRIQMNFQDPLILIKQQHLIKMNKILNDLIVVQSSLLEEIGDPIEALKCLDEQYAMMQYDEKFQKLIKQIFSRKLSTEDHEFAVTKCKIATFLLFQNLFEQSISSLLQIEKFTTNSCQNIIHSLGEVRVSALSSLWDVEGIKLLHNAKQQQLEAFQTYKVLFYQSQLKLLEAYTWSGQMSEALSIYSFLLPHYLKLPDRYLEALFEYSFGIYALNDWDIKMALLFYESALYNLDEQIITGHQNTFMDKRHFKIKPLINDSFRDFYSSIQLEQDILQQLNHHFTLKSRCKLMYCQARLETENYPELFPIIVRHLENIRKTVGRTSILYVDTLLVYTDYLLRFKENNTIMTILKSIFKAEYFISKKEHDYFKPSIFNDRSGVQSSNNTQYLDFVFYQQEEIEMKFNEALVTTWINELLLQIKEFYTEYFIKVKIDSHLQLVNCYLQLHRIAYCEKKITTCMNHLQTAEAMLLKICPSMNHHLAIQIYVRYAMLCDNVNQIKENHIDVVLNSKVMDEFSYEQRTAIIEAILLNDPQIEEYFDKYYVEKFDIFLVKNLQAFLQKRGISQSLPMRANQKGSKKNIKWIPTEQEKSILKHRAISKILQEPEKQPDYQRIGAIGFYRKAFMICNKIFKNDNPLKQRVSDTFVELSSKEQRDMNNIKEQREMNSPKNRSYYSNDSPKNI